MIHFWANLHLDVIMGVLVGSALGYALGWIRGRGRRQ
jgi:membrane protein DedA with SNARE-associated domain